MSLIVLLCAALLQLPAPAGSMRPSPHPEARIVPARQTGEQRLLDGLSATADHRSGPAAEGRRERLPGRASGADGMQDPAPAPLARTSDGPRRTRATATRETTAATRALDGGDAGVHGWRAALEGASATTADRTSRAMAASGRLVANLPIPPPVG